MTKANGFGVTEYEHSGVLTNINVQAPFYKVQASITPFDCEDIDVNFMISYEDTISRVDLGSGPAGTRLQAVETAVKFIRGHNN